MELATSVELHQSFPFSSKTLSAYLIVVHDNISKQIDLIHHSLLLNTIFFDEVLESFLRSKRNFHVVDRLDEALTNILVINMLSRTNIFSKDIIWSSSNVKNISHRGCENLRVAGCRKRFCSRVIAYCHNPRSTWFVSMRI